MTEHPMTPEPQKGNVVQLSEGRESLLRRWLKLVNYDAKGARKLQEQYWRLFMGQPAPEDGDDDKR